MHRKDYGRRWRAEALDAGVPPVLADLGCQLIRQAHDEATPGISPHGGPASHGDDRLLYALGPEYWGGMINHALKDPSDAEFCWKCLMAFRQWPELDAEGMRKGKPR